MRETNIAELMKKFEFLLKMDGKLTGKQNIEFTVGCMLHINKSCYFVFLDSLFDQQYVFLDADHKKILFIDFLAKAQLSDAALKVLIEIKNTIEEEKRRYVDLDYVKILAEDDMTFLYDDAYNNGVLVDKVQTECFFRGGELRILFPNIRNTTIVVNYHGLITLYYEGNMISLEVLRYATDRTLRCLYNYLKILAAQQDLVFYWDYDKNEGIGMLGQTIKFFEGVRE